MDVHEDCNERLFDKERHVHMLAKDVESLKKSVEEIKHFLGIQSPTDNGPTDNGPAKDYHSSRISEDCCKDSDTTDNWNSDYEIKGKHNCRKKKDNPPHQPYLQDDTNFIVPQPCTEKHISKARVNENVHNVLITYAMESTYHGLRYVFGRDVSAIRRVLWLIVCIVSYLAFLNLCGLAISRYLSYPVSSTIKQHYAAALQFPALTICNNNRFRKTKYTEAVKNGSIPDILYIFDGEEDESSTDSYEVKDDTEHSHGIDKRSDTSANSAINWEHFLTGVGHQFNDTLKKKEFFEVHAGKAHDINLTVTSFILAQDARVCHRVTFHNITTGTLLESTVAEQIIELQLDPQKAEYMAYDAMSELVGFYVSFHPPHSFPTSTNLIPLMNLNRHHEVKINKKVEKNLPLPYGNSDCKVPQNGSSHYSQNMCKLKCMSEIMFKQCGCRSIGYPGNETIPLCETPHLWAPDPCIAKLHLMDKCLHCDPPCERTIYDVNINSYGKPEKFMGLYLYFNDYAYTEIEQQAVYPMASLFGDLGGYLGLLIGASVMSLVELLDLVCRIFVMSLSGGVHRIRRAATARKVTSDEDNEWM